ncbi:conserved hypothetical protein [Nostocoides australiense Ben110]|uniref:Polysaccharide pyruvyl transferase domain-containing protein n=1 Tax=Nostocoides australiense Ben110 TaxID=1193182 RepID=W6JSX4_9MICO|nr:polysaccharide pyruvyl transferase family protein [Tetrasphaera australiensis]CCH72293.1 conserved hypothetical protein [Tetrasphaera australiensis Ben110]
MRIAIARSVATSWFPARGALPFSQGFPRSNDTRLRSLRANHTLAGNAGNMIISESLGRILGGDRLQATSSYLEILRFRELGWSPGKIAAFVEEHFDLVVFPMANHVRPGSRLGDLAEIVEGLRTDFLVFGLGLQEAIPAELSGLDPGTERLFRIFDERSKVFGVRGDQTAAWLAAAGLTRAKPLGCPSLYVYPSNLLGITAPKATMPGRAITAGHIHQRSRRSRALFRLFAGWQASYVMQDELFRLPGVDDGDDIYNDATGELDARVISAALARIHRRRAPFAGYRYFQDVDAWRMFATQHDMYVGDRFHGAVAAMQAGVPALVLGVDVRVAELCTFFGIPFVPIESARKQDLRSLVRSSLSESAVASFKETYVDRLKAFHAAMAESGVPVARPIGVGWPTQPDGLRSPQTRASTLGQAVSRRRTATASRLRRHGPVN